MKYSIGVDIGGTKCAVLLGTGSSEGFQEKVIFKKYVFETPKTGGPEEAVPKIIALIENLLKEFSLSKEEIIGIGVSCGGPLDSKNGVILSPPNLYRWINVPICKILSEHFSLPVALENDANACAVAEWKFGAGKGQKNMIFLTFGTGLGAGLILDGRLYSGENGMAGEVGHIRLSEFGPVGFGKAGSFEGFCSGGGIAEIARMKVLEYLQQGKYQSLCSGTEGIPSLTAKTVAQAADRGDELAKEIYSISGAQLGKGLAVLIDILNPGMVVLGSIFERSSHLLWPAAQKALLSESLAAANGVCQVVPSKLGDSIGDYAAVSIAVYHFGS